MVALQLQLYCEFYVATRSTARVSAFGHFLLLLLSDRFPPVVEISKFSRTSCKRVTRFNIFLVDKNCRRERKEAITSARGLFVDHENVSCCANNWHGCPRLSRLLMRLAVCRVARR